MCEDLEFVCSAHGFGCIACGVKVASKASKLAYTKLGTLMKEAAKVKRALRFFSAVDSCGFVIGKFIGKFFEFIAGSSGIVHGIKQGFLLRSEEDER